MKAHLINTHLLVPRSRSSAKVQVKYQGHVSLKMGVSGALVFHKRILVFFLTRVFTQNYSFAEKLWHQVVALLSLFSHNIFEGHLCLEYLIWKVSG